MAGADVLVFANKQDLPGAVDPASLVAAFDLPSLRGRKWFVQGAVATRGEGLYEGLDWLAAVLRDKGAGRVVASEGRR